MGNRRSETPIIQRTVNADKARDAYNAAKQNYRTANGGSVRGQAGASTGATTGASTGASTGAPTGATRDVWDKVKKPLMVAGGATLGAGGAGTIGYAMGHSTGR